MPHQRNMAVELPVHLRYLHQDKNIPIEELVKNYNQYSQASIYRHAKKPNLSLHPSPIRVI